MIHQAGQSGETPARVTVSIVSHGQSELIEPLLHQLASLAEGEPLNVHITENIPDARPKVVSTSNCRLKWIENRQPQGFGANHNAAFQNCSTPYFIVLNPDVRLTEKGWSDLLDCLAQRPGVAGPRVVSVSGTLEDSARRIPSLTRIIWRRLGGGSVLDYDAGVSLQAVDWLAGMCLAFDRESFALVGGFEERYFLYCEDVDICLRLHLAGRNVSWVQSSVVVHDAQRSSRKNVRYLFWHVSSLLKLMCSKPYWRFRLA